VTRSRAVHLVLLVSSVAALEACSRRQQCLDQNNMVVDDRFCQGQAPVGSFGYRWYSHSGSPMPVGSHVSSSSSGTAHGVFGGAGDAAGHASGHGGGGGE
jgi:hypothetical protein